MSLCLEDVADCSTATAPDDLWQQQPQAASLSLVETLHLTAVTKRLTD